MSTAQNALATIPENVQVMLSKAPQGLIQRLGGYLTPEMLAIIETAETHEEAVEMLQTLANSLQSDENAAITLPVYTIQHQTQKGVSKKWLDPAGDTAGDTLYLVPLVWMPMRGAFVEGRKPPLCSAKGTSGKGMAAADAGTALSKWFEEQGKVQTTFIDWSGKEKDCATCPLNNFATDFKGRSGKACKEKDVVLFALVKKNSDGTLEVTDEGYGCNVPTTSRKGWHARVDKLRQRKVDGRKAPLSSLQVIWGFKLETAESDVNSYGVINPEVIRPLTPEEFKRVMRMHKDALKVAEQIGADYGENYDEVTSSAGEGAGQQGPQGMGNELQQGEDVPF